jgi:hypothetical protein
VVLDPEFNQHLHLFSQAFNHAKTGHLRKFTAQNGRKSTGMCD